MDEGEEEEEEEDDGGNGDEGSRRRRRRERRDSIRRMEGIARLEEETERIRAMVEADASGDVSGSGGERRGVQGDFGEIDDEEENLRARRREQEVYAEQLMTFVRGRLGMFASSQPPSGSAGAAAGAASGAVSQGSIDRGIDSREGPSKANMASRMILENMQKTFSGGGGASRKQEKYGSPKKSLRARRRESRLWNNIGEIGDEISGVAGVGEAMEEGETAGPIFQDEEEEEETTTASTPLPPSPLPPPTLPPQSALS